MFNILDIIQNGFVMLNDPIGLAGSLITIFDHFRNQNKNHIDDTLNTMRKKSEAAYEQYCGFRKYRQDDLGVPNKEDILGYWETCLQRSILPGRNDMVSSNIASEEEAEIIIPYLMEQWMTVPEFSTWLHDILNQNHLEKISKKLADLPLVLEAASQIKEQLDIQGFCNIATLIGPGYVNDARCSCSDSTIKNFFTVDNDFHTMLQVISADEDVPHQEAAYKVMELVKNGSPVIITGNGGQGKTSLMMSTAVQWVSSGRLAVWLSLSNKEIITEQVADRFFDCLIKFVPQGQRVLLCIDNPFEGRASFSSLRARWPHKVQLQLLMAERENRLTLLANPDQDLLLRWFDNAELIVLQGINSDRTYHLKDYRSHFFPEDRERRKNILEKCTSYMVKEGIISEKDQLSITNQTLNQYGKPYVSLVELIYRTLFELKKVASKPESIKLDWEEWGELINQEFKDVDSDIQLYGIIAALKVFNTPLSLSLFCKYFELNERKLRNRLCELFAPRHVEPVIYQEGNRTLQPKHDVIAELFFLFNRDKVTIDSLVLDLIEVMDENEIDVFLENVVNKWEIRKGKKHPIGEVNYWRYMENIYVRIQRGTCNLSQTGRANLCLGFLWAENQRDVSGNSPTVKTILKNIAPDIEDDLLIIKLYTEWGIWEASQRNDSLAEEKFLSVIECNPKQLPVRTELGRLLSRQKGREAEAEKFLREAIQINSKHIQSRTELGRLLSKQKGREAEAEKFLREIIEIAPQDIQSRTELGRLLSRQKGREAEAEKFLREIIEIDLRNIHSRTELGRLLSRQKGREAEAEKFLREAIQINFKHIQSRTELGRLLSRQKGREAEAEKFLREAIQINSKHIQSRMELGRLLSRQKGREAEAEKFLREIIEIAPRDIQSRIELGRLLSRQKGREAEAEIFLQEAMQINNDLCS